MKLEEIIEKVKHDADYFTKAQNLFQSGRCFEAQKILDMLYLLEPAQLHKPVVMQAEVSDGAKGATVGNSAAGQSGSGGCDCLYCRDKN